MVRDVKEQLWKDLCAKLDIPINARVSVFGHCSFPVLNSTTLSFICKGVPVDNCLLLFALRFMYTNIVPLEKLQCPFALCRLVCMRLHRFYVLQPLGEEVVIEDVPTIKQWLKVFRYTQGDSVILFNGDSYEYVYQLQETSQTRCVLTLTEKKQGLISTRKSYLYLTCIKKDLFELVCEKATECGVTDIIPIITDRTEKKHLNEERLRTIIKEASEQSGRGDILTLHPTVTLQDALNDARSLTSIDNIYVATLFGQSLSEKIQASKKEEPSPLAFFVGPEGGWTPEEESLFEEEQLQRVSLGKTTLRAETAGIAVAVVIPLL
jgi:16S rRNA (uracil1498-N3)-methyltransferase